MDTMKLTPRLQCVANCVKKCSLLADIGTDHAYIPIYTVQKGIADKAIASDIVKGPLKIAADNIKAHNLEDKITTSMANGLDSAEDADVTVIAGMGGKLICTILSDNIEIAKKSDYMVLQPMTCSYELRKYLHSNGFEITDERLAKEENKIYNIMVVKEGNEKFEDEFYYYIGKKLFEKHDPLLSEYIRMRAEVIKKQYVGMKSSENRDLHQKAEKLEKLYYRFIEEADNYDKGF